MENEEGEIIDHWRERALQNDSPQASYQLKSYTLRSKPKTLRNVEKDDRIISLSNGKAKLTLDKDIFNADDSGNDETSSPEEDTCGIFVAQPKKESARKMGSTRSGTLFKEYTETAEPVEEKEWYDDFIQDGDDTNIELSGKLVLLLEIIANAEIVGDKVLVFSQSLSSLDLIERTLGGGRIGGNEISWCKGVDYFRLDGSTAARSRQRYSEIFNDVDNTT